MANSLQAWFKQEAALFETVAFQRGTSALMHTFPQTVSGAPQKLSQYEQQGSGSTDILRVLRNLLKLHVKER